MQIICPHFIQINAESKAAQNFSIISGTKNSGVVTQINSG